MAKHTLKILRCEHHKIYKVCLAILQYYACFTIFIIMKVLNNLVRVLLWFRQGKFCVIPDMKKMFHQVMVNQRDRDALRFIWRSNRDENFRDIQMNVHLFGKVDSPCCRTWALSKTASDNIVKIVSRAKEEITDNFYMDDYLYSIHTVQEAIKVSNDVTNALSEGGFRLTNGYSMISKS